VKRLAGIVLAVILAVSACNKGPDHGTISDMQIGAAYTWYMPICLSQSKYGCMIWYQMPINEPERYYISIVSENNEYNRCQTTQVRYNNAHLGQPWNCDANSS